MSTVTPEADYMCPFDAVDRIDFTPYADDSPTDWDRTENRPAVSSEDPYRPLNFQ